MDETGAWRRLSSLIQGPVSSLVFLREWMLLFIEEGRRGTTSCLS